MNVQNRQTLRQSRAAAGGGGGVGRGCHSVSLGEMKVFWKQCRRSHTSVNVLKTTELHTSEGQTSRYRNDTSIFFYRKGLRHINDIQRVSLAQVSSQTNQPL